MTPDTADAALARLRESVLFYLKVDLGSIAGLATLASTMKLEPTDILKQVVNLRQGVVGFFGLIAFAMLIEMSITYFRGAIATGQVKPPHLTWPQRICFVLYLVQVGCHAFMLAFLAGMTSEYLRFVASAHA